MPIWLIPYVFYLIALAVCGLAYWKGDTPLRLASMLVLIAWTLSPFISERNRHGWDFPVAVLDTNVAIFITLVSLRWRRVWAAVLAAVSILIVLVRVVAVTHHDIRIPAFLAANNILAVSQLVILVFAIWVTSSQRRTVHEGLVQP